ncbi:MAG: hypothetical protein ACYCYP_04880 [Leptospirales bacterium]
MESQKERMNKTIQEIIREADKAKNLIDMGDEKEADQVLLAIHRTLRGYLRIP